MKIKEVQAWQWKCPYCHYNGICTSHDKAYSELREHIAGCCKNPIMQNCGSCIYCKDIRCVKYKQNYFEARYTHMDAGYDCVGWECKTHLKKIQDKLRGDK